MSAFAARDDLTWTLMNQCMRRYKLENPMKGDMNRDEEVMVQVIGDYKQGRRVFIPERPNLLAKKT